MLTDTEIENQTVLVEDLKNQMPIWEPPDGAVLPGYIHQLRFSTVFGVCRDGIDFVPLDEKHVAWRKSDDGEWTICDLDDLRQAVIHDVEEILTPVPTGYIATCQWFNRAGSGEWTEGIDFVALDENVIAWRSSGDFRDDSEWRIGDLSHFREVVVVDAEEVLARWIEEAEEAEDA